MIKKIDIPSIRDSVYMQMREMILDGVWAPGTRIDLNQLAAEFGVSKTPLNEAIQMLIREGILAVKPRSGTFVSALDLDEILETFDFRLILEKGAAEAILANASAPILRGLETLNDRMAEIAENPGSLEDYRRMLRLDDEFHQKIMFLSGNAQLIEHYEQLSARLMLMRMIGTFSPKDYKATISDHRAILAALRSGDWEAFSAASATHVANAKAKVRRGLGSASTK
ncbi:GntR family transcriptional regulator [Rhodovulum sulfidophilum]|nr:GntR family transcriptional regulator [Rhodovulum sulfidophilum]